MYSRVLTLAAALLAVSAVAADDKPAPDKPKPGLKDGADLPGLFHPYNVNGKYEKKFHCLINEHGLNPTVMVFAQNYTAGAANDPLPQLLRKLDAYIVERPKTRLNAFAVFLYNDMADVVTADDVREAHADALGRIKSQEPALRQVVLALEGSTGLQKAGYTLSPEDQVVVVLYDRLKVKHLYAFTAAKPLTAADVDGIMKEVTENFAPYKK
jgi:hypothetical protein